MPNMEMTPDFIVHVHKTTFSYKKLKALLRLKCMPGTKTLTLKPKEPDGPVLTFKLDPKSHVMLEEGPAKQALAEMKEQKRLP